MRGFVLYGARGWGSVLVEAQLVLYGLPFDFVDTGDLYKPGAAVERLRAVNPLLQVPALELPGGTVMTESAAITLHLADLTGSRDLVPAAHDSERAAFLRWLVFLVANVYPTFTYGDVPTRFVADAAAAKAFREATDAHARKLWRMAESAAGAPWFLGDRFGALDVYVATMTRWRPGRRWFEAETPRLAAIARHADAHEGLAPVWARHFD